MSHSNYVETLNKDNFDLFLSESTEPVLVDFWADWCAPCRVVAPSVERLAREHVGRLRVAKLDIEAEPERASEMIERSGRRTVPQIFIGDRHVGGFDDLYALDNAGELDPLLAEVAS